MNTHYGVIHFNGDYDDNHPDPELRGAAPNLELIAAGDEQFCWDSLNKWIKRRPLQRGQTVEVLARDPIIATQEQHRSDAYRESLTQEDTP